MLYQVVIAIGLLVFLVNFILNLINLKRPSRKAKLPLHPPRVSVMVPARDEEANIEACLASLMKQDYPNVEILVLDDNSSDNTAAIVNKLAKQDSRIRLIRGLPLPEGWAGKPFACQQMADQATGKWFLFVDADTTHEPHMLRSVIAMARELDTDLLSGFPRQRTSSFAPKIGIPLIYFIVMSWFPLWLLQSFRQPKPSLSIGQFLLFRRDAYLRIGGHATVKCRILEDVCLGVEIVRNGGRHVAVDLTRVVSCAMYHDLPGVWEGYTKWGYSVASLSTIGLGILIPIAYLFYMAPFMWLWNEFFILPAFSPWHNIILLQVGIILFIRVVESIRFRDSLLSAVFHPLGLGCLIVNFFIATVRRLTGAGVTWKKREYGGESFIH